jgi:alpha-ketoglutarate-dependent 2,4-dichlorophenoxyacetate dioxygenase
MAEARIYLRDLIEHAIQPRFVYVHHWQSHDPVMWDNRQTMHHVRRFDETENLRDIR